MDNKIDKIQLDNCIGKIAMYKNEEESSLKKLIKIENKILDNYSSLNEKKISSLNFEFSNNIKVLINKRTSYIKVIRHNIIKYNNLELHTFHKFNSEG